MEKDGFGIFTIFLPNNPDGTAAIPHGSRVKIHLQVAEGSAAAGNASTVCLQSLGWFRTNPQQPPPNIPLYSHAYLVLYIQYNCAGSDSMLRRSLCVAWRGGGLGGLLSAEQGEKAH